jgi:uncharacterized protein (TIGR02466 family)
LDIAGVLSLAVQHHQAGRLPQAQALYREVLEADADNPDALHLLGVLASQIGEHDKALALIERAIQRSPQNSQLYASLAGVLHALGRVDQAIAALARAHEIDPSDVVVLTNMGALRQERGQLDEAVADYRRAAELNPDYADVYYNLATALKDLGRLDDAIAALRRAIEIRSDSAHDHVVLAGYLLERGDFESALQACDSALRLMPLNIRALGFKSAALTGLGRYDALRTLVDFDRLVVQRRVSPPSGFSSLGEFNAALIDHVRNHPSMICNPITGATRGGDHTEELLVEPKGPFAFFEHIVNDAVSDYLQTLPMDPTHPYLAHRPRRWRLTVWGVVLRAQGHQIAHIHPGGWVGGVYYAKLPAAVNSGTDQPAGWIEFGRPPEEFSGDAMPDVRLFKPEEGLLLLFPSYLYHRTVPYESKDERVSIAFDALPEFGS